MQRTILVSGASGVVGYGILKSLRRGEENLRLIGSSIYDFSVAPKFCDIFVKAIPTSDSSYLDWLFHLIKKYSIDMIIPGIEIDMFTWNSNRKQLLEMGTFPLLNNSTLIDICKDKWLFYQCLLHAYKDILIPTAIDYNKLNFSFPVLLKPRIGFGSKGIVKISNVKDLENYRAKIGKELMIQPLIGTDDEEYTVSGFFDTNSDLLNLISFKRKLSKEGFTQEAQVVNIDIENSIQKLAYILKPVGPTNFQFRIERGCFKLLEVNPRISSATSIRSALGYNESKMSIDYFLNEKTPERFDVLTVLHKRAIRYSEDYIE